MAILSASAATELAIDEMLPLHRANRRAYDRIDRWARWDHDKPHTPTSQPSAEYTELMARSYTPWLSLVVTAVAQSLYVDGYRRADSAEPASAWEHWQRNRMDARQGGIYRAALEYGESFGVGLPGTDVDGNHVPILRGLSPRQMTATWEDSAADEWPLYALEVRQLTANAWRLKLYDDMDVHKIRYSDGKAVYEGADRHGVGVVPVVRYANQLDLEGRTPGEVEPLIPVAGRIDQTTFDRLVVQRFASWIVRTISGLSPPDDKSEAAAQKLMLKVEDLLIAADPDTKFGSLPATPLDPFVEAKDADIRDLAAVSQTPPHHLLGQMANLSAEALAAAEASLNRKITERKTSFGESHESLLRLSARIAGDEEGWRDVHAQVQWRDMESRSLAQAADALGKLRQTLGVPAEALWERIPGATLADVERWKQMAQEGDGISALVDALNSTVERRDALPEGE